MITLRCTDAHNGNYDGYPSLIVIAVPIQTGRRTIRSLGQLTRADDSPAIVIPLGAETVSLPTPPLRVVIETKAGAISPQPLAIDAIELSSGARVYQLSIPGSATSPDHVKGCTLRVYGRDEPLITVPPNADTSSP